MMNKSMIIKKEVDFKSSSNEVWNLLTNPEMTKQYMFGCEVISNWKIGDSIIWKGKTENGEEITYVKGKITKYEVGKIVTFTMFDPNMGIADIPENYVSLTYQVSLLQSGCRLTISQGNFSGTENAKKRFEESKKGWEMVIPLMKSLLNE